MAERLKAPVLKTGEGRPSVGSNPTPTANESLFAETVPRTEEQAPARRGFLALGIHLERVHLRPQKPRSPRISPEALG